MLLLIFFIFAIADNALCLFVFAAMLMRDIFQKSEVGVFMFPVLKINKNSTFQMDFHDLTNNDSKV